MTSRRRYHQVVIVIKFLDDIFTGPDEDYLIDMPENVHTLQQFSYPKNSPSIGMCTLPHFNLTIAFARSNGIPDCNDDKSEISREMHEICELSHVDS